MSDPEPLEGIRVVELGRALQGPVAAQYLADVGADVIKVEPAIGDANRGVRGIGDDGIEGGFGTQFVTANRGKRSLWLDLRREESLRAVRTLVTRADVFVSNYLEPSLKAMGLGWEELHAERPELIWALVSGYGPEGPDAQKRMLDGSAAARGGLYAMTGAPEGGPMVAGAAVADTAGAMQLALGIMTAIAARERHGGGQRVDVSAFGAQLWLQMWEIDTVGLTGRHLTRQGRYQDNIHGTYGTYETADGAVMIAFLADEETWVSFCRFADLDELILDPRFDTPRKRAGGGDPAGAISNQIRPYLETAFRSKTTAEWVAFLATLPSLVWDVVQDYEQVLQDPQATANGYVVEQEIPTYGARRLVGNLVRFNGEPAPIKSAPPQLGAHNTEILSELGYSPREIEEMTEAARDALRARLDA